MSFVKVLIATRRKAKAGRRHNCGYYRRKNLFQNLLSRYARLVYAFGEVLLREEIENQQRQNTQQRARHINSFVYGLARRAARIAEQRLIRSFELFELERKGRNRTAEVNRG